MAKVEVRDHAIWIKHIHGDERLAGKLSQMPAGTLIELIVDGVQGHGGRWMTARMAVPPTV